jgi:phosphate/phosphite/phosphonate ABC transporter binding protein
LRGPVPPVISVVLLAALLGSCTSVPSDAPVPLSLSPRRSLGPAARSPAEDDPAPFPACPPGTAVVPMLRLGLPAHGVPRMRDTRALADLLGARAGTPVEIIVSDRYEDLTSGLRTGSLDAAVLPPLEYVRAKDLDPCLEARLTQVMSGRARYSAFLVVRKDSGLTDPRQLAGRRVAFVGPDSASGWLFAVNRLLESGIDPFRDTAEVRFLGNHRAVLLAVLEKASDAGATYPGALEAARRDGLDVGALTLLSIGGRIPHDAVVVRPGLDAGQARALVEAMASVNTLTPEGRQALALQEGLNGWIPTTDAFYDEVRGVERRVRNLAGGAR